MILYHGTNLEIQTINLALCRPYKDFGKGFYTTEILRQAQKMAERTAKIYGGSPIVNVYEISDSFMEDHNLHIKDFGNTPSKDWALFIMNNRSRAFTDFKNICCNHDLKYDIVSGPVADDDMNMLFRQYQNHFISLETVVNKMIFKKTTSQYSFHTEKAIRLLKKAGIL